MLILEIISFILPAVVRFSCILFTLCTYLFISLGIIQTALEMCHSMIFWYIVQWLVVVAASCSFVHVMHLKILSVCFSTCNEIKIL